MRALIASIRAVFAGTITASSTGSTLASIEWWDDVDVVGHSAYWPLGNPTPIGQPPSPASLATAWLQWLPRIAGVAAAARREVPAFLWWLRF